MQRAASILSEMMRKEPPEYLETWRPVRPETAARLNVYVPGDTGWVTHGSLTFKKLNGQWMRLKRTKNPAFYALPRYFFMAPGPGKLSYIIVKMPRTLRTRPWRSACAGIYRDATGKSWSNAYGERGRHTARAVVDNADEKTYAKSVSGKRPEPAYEIFADGRWERTS